MIEVEQFRADAAAWLTGQQPSAPPDWGAIMPAERREQGMEWQQRLHAAGYAAIHWPVEYGGQGLTIEHHQAWMECCADAGVPPFLNMVGLVLAGGSLQTKAELDGDEWVVSGQKVWCSGGRASDWGILLARTERDVPKHQGISFFLIDMRSPGVETRPLRQMTEPSPSGSRRSRRWPRRRAWTGRPGTGWSSCTPAGRPTSP